MALIVFALFAAELHPIAAQQTPAPLPQAPGQGTPSSPPGAATPLPGPTVVPGASPLESPSPSALPSALPGASPGSAITPQAAPAQPSGAQTPPAATAKPAIVRFTGQLLDFRNGYVYFTTADAFKVSPALQIVDLDTGQPTTRKPAAPLYARATLDPASGSITELALTRRKLAQDAAYQQAYAQAHAYAATGSPTVPAPELRGVRVTGRAVAVTFYVQVPPTTPLSDSVYITTDASGWVANAMKMDRIDALHYRLTRTYASGTKFAYRFTRGSWTSVEVGEDGLQDDPHQFFVPEVDAKRLTDVVYRWSDQNPSQPQVGPDSIPTPFNPNPFGGLPSAIQHPGVPVPSPTPRP
jgi:hypothetical protein